MNDVFWFHRWQVIRRVHTLIRLAMTPHQFDANENEYISGLHKSVENIAKEIRRTNKEI